MNSGNPIEALVDFLRMATHIDIIKFNQMYVQIMAHKDSLDAILTITGRLETYISIACYRESVKDNYCLPIFEGNNYVAKDLYHPLIENAVANDLNADRGVLITGSNASGKSTFLKTCALNALLAQSIHTVLAKEYKAPLYRIYSSMALKDDIFEGDSYYIVEIKSIKRILDASKEEGNPVLCFVDEVLRGTNTVERIAASTEILKNFAGKNIMCLAATHDIELTSLLKDYFGIYHFEGEITDNDVHFDYKIKSGPATTRNAIKLLNVLGYDENIVDNAQSLAEKFLSTGHWD
jgi:DNA mismatch repair ATPase MutS